ncbi:YugN family protein [Paenibacillus thermotolerans]|uniref:YugN family protein n=1 Tax=Paenibacillus thermotolerans TaxID=3027807 RepID=UPI002367F1A4|nr:MULTISPECIES: YugN family protein [unclassified Paenibacillus]
MIQLESKLSGIETDYKTLQELLERNNFTLGGNWEYSKGCFDRALDGEKQTVWLRIPFDVPNGNFDPSASDERTRLTLGTPVVLNHQYNTGDDRSAETGVFSGMVNQFQSPADPNGPVDEQYVKKAEEIVRELELQL